MTPGPLLPYHPHVDTLITESPAQTEAAGEALARRVPAGAVIVLSGPLGSGKTTFVRGVAVGLGIRDTVTSPSYAIIMEYGTPPRLVHIDLYRTSSDEELMLLGLEDAIDSDALKVIEWGERAESFLPPDCVRVEIRIVDGTRRRISIRGDLERLH